MFSIDYDFGWLSDLILGLLIAAGGVALVFFLLAAKRGRDDVVEEMHDHGEDASRLMCS